MFPMSKTEIAQMAVQMAVAMKATQVAEQTVASLTSFDTETITVKVGTTVTGHLVAWKLKPVTDKAVVTVAKKIAIWKSNKNAK